MINAEGIVVDIRFRNEDSYYTVFSLDTDDGPITVVGKIAQINVGDSIKVFGNLIYHSIYGEQIQLETYEKVMPSTMVQIEKYLASGIFPFIGKKTAREIVKRFKEQSLDIMTEEPMRLKEISGLGKKKIEKIHEAVMKEKESRNTFIFLQSLGLGNKLSIEIYRKYKGNTIEIIRENPYILIDDIKGIGFNIADKIALRNNIRPDSPFRIAAGITYFLNQSANVSGHCYLNEKYLIDEVANLLGVDSSLISEEIVNLQYTNKLKKEKIDSEEVIYLRRIYEIEKSVVSSVLKLIYSQEKELNNDLDKIISEIEEFENIKYSETQREAIKSAVSENIMVITGGPGTGKTTIIKGIISILEQLNKKYILCAPTGRAAKRMEESTGKTSSTIHRLLGYKSIEDEENFLDHDENNPIDTDVIIIDEMSMVDIFLMNNLMRAVNTDTKVILVGDVDQLPSVGAGNVLNDLIDSEAILTVKLDTIFRQGKESNIVKNAHLINTGKLPILNEEGKDFFFVKTRSDTETLNTVVDLVKNRLPSHYGVDALKDIQVLTPTKKGICGTENLNYHLQNSLNPKEFNRMEMEYQNTVYREQDKVMQIRNNYDLELRDNYGNLYNGIYNGDIGFIRNVFTDTSSIEVIIDEKRALYEFKDLSDLALSYAITIHKSQGSEFPIVVIPMFNAPFMLLTRNILYTGVTRGRSLVVLVGDEAIMRKMIENTFRQKRNSGLCLYLKRAVKDIGELYGI